MQTDPSGVQDLSMALGTGEEARQDQEIEFLMS